MSSSGPSREELLLDLHLGQLDDGNRAWLEAELTRDAQFRAQSELLGRILRPLDHWQTAQTPPNLADRVLSRISAARFQQAGQVRSNRVFRFPRGRELLAAAASVGILVTLGIPTLSMMRNRSREALCAANMQTIFAGTSAYQQAYAGALPYAGSIAGASWLPVTDRGTPFASNSKHPYLLVKHRFGPRAKQFVCPADERSKSADVADERTADDFPNVAAVSYDSLNLAGGAPNLRPSPAMAYLSDPNPLFVGAKFNEGVDADRENSPAHHGRGQTVLFLDGSARFARSPIYGARQDNLWLIDGVRSYRGTEVPTRTDDAFLVPGRPTAGN